MRAFLILEDGTVFEGVHIGARKEIISEIVFNTSMAGYPEVLTDPSYAGQAVCMTYPLIGNYGICREDMESKKPWTDGLIVRELSRMGSNFRMDLTLEQFLEFPANTGYFVLEPNIRKVEDVGWRYLAQHLDVLLPPELLGLIPGL